MAALAERWGSTTAMDLPDSRCVGDALGLRGARRATRSLTANDPYSLQFARRVCARRTTAARGRTCTVWKGRLAGFGRIDVARVCVGLAGVGHEGSDQWRRCGPGRARFVRYDPVRKLLHRARVSGSPRIRATWFIATFQPRHARLQSAVRARSCGRSPCLMRSRPGRAAGHG